MTHVIQSLDKGAGWDAESELMRLASWYTMSRNFPGLRIRLCILDWAWRLCIVLGDSVGIGTKL